MIIYNTQIVDKKNSKYYNELEIKESKKFFRKGLKFI